MTSTAERPMEYECTQCGNTVFGPSENELKDGPRNGTCRNCGTVYQFEDTIDIGVFVRPLEVSS